MNDPSIPQNFFSNASSALSACWYLKNFLPCLKNELTEDEHHQIDADLQKLTSLIMSYDLPF